MGVIPKGITVEDIHQAIQDYAGGAEHTFGPSTFYDLLYNGARYPPKAILGLAARRLAHRVLQPNEFSGGEESECFKVLRGLGFEIVRKAAKINAGESTTPLLTPTWIEITSLHHGHGGPGWEFGRFLWSPVRDASGNERYRLMRDPRPGDRVLHFVKRVRQDGRDDLRVEGVSRVAAAAHEVMTEPPQPGDWGGMAPYHRIELSDYEPFEAALPIAELVRRRGQEIRDEIEQDDPRYYPLVRYGERKDESPGIRTAQGMYLARCTERLLRLIREEMNSEPAWDAWSASVSVNRVISLAEALKELEAAALRRGLNYSRDTLQAFLLSLKSKPFCILAGPTGTGKSALARLLGDLGAEVRVVPVEPSWTDGTSVFGYRDLNGQYRHGILSAQAVLAAGRPDRLHVLVLDELNLARVEHYLAQWLSVIESRRFDGDTVVADLLVQDGDDAQVALPENMCVVGTVNMDESTLSFSQRVLDRANVLFLPSPKDVRVNLAGRASSMREAQDPLVLDPHVLRPTAISWAALTLAAGPAEQAELERALDVLQATQEALEQAHTRARISYRLRDEICSYLLHGLQGGFGASMEQLLDQQLRQRLLPKLCDGSEELSPTLVKDLQALWGSLNPEPPNASVFLAQVADLQERLDMPVSLWTALS